MMRHDERYEERARLRRLRMFRLHVSDALRCAESDTVLADYRDALRRVLASVNDEIGWEESRHG